MKKQNYLAPEVEAVEVRVETIVCASPFGVTSKEVDELNYDTIDNWDD